MSEVHSLNSSKKVLGIESLLIQSEEIRDEIIQYLDSKTLLSLLDDLIDLEQKNEEQDSSYSILKIKLFEQLYPKFSFYNDHVEKLIQLYDKFNCLPSKIETNVLGFKNIINLGFNPKNQVSYHVEIYNCRDEFNELKKLPYQLLNLEGVVISDGLIPSEHDQENKNYFFARDPFLRNMKHISFNHSGRPYEEDQDEDNEDQNNENQSNKVIIIRPTPSLESLYYGEFSPEPLNFNEFSFDDNEIDSTLFFSLKHVIDLTFSSLKHVSLDLSFLDDGDYCYGLLNPLASFRLPEQIESLTLKSAAIQDLEGIEKFQKLKHLHLEYNICFFKCFKTNYPDSLESITINSSCDDSSSRFYEEYFEKFYREVSEGEIIEFEKSEFVKDRRGIIFGKDFKAPKSLKKIQIKGYYGFNCGFNFTNGLSQLTELNLHGIFDLDLVKTLKNLSNTLKILIIEKCDITNESRDRKYPIYLNFPLKLKKIEFIDNKFGSALYFENILYLEDLISLKIKGNRLTIPWGYKSNQWKILIGENYENWNKDEFFKYASKQLYEFEVDEDHYTKLYKNCSK
ncbi:uncharacterized protein KGF55_003126 [Candida pseudojiufengensis]|uniref:uncharacterized protein n=1 Tax=Candida pseudojiufengensis TaxID=497109 RepID=UPI002224DF5E|nr:uncharacterized protein KGF55_003126 [Candida pseudojiufengensis]KAI5963334.1 hypothetical protein KGF55_003126 [Candida pseudojiufengensis]